MIPTSVTRSTSCCGSRAPPGEPVLGLAVGPWPPGLAHRVLGLGAARAGETIDLHGGGSDLIYPHHECEAAQSESVTGVPFVRHWMHVGMVCLDGEKMSKSLGNLVFVDALLKEWAPAAVRLAILANHYRPEWHWDDSLMPTATERLDRWRAVGEGHAALDEVRAALDDDLDCPRAIAAIDDAARRGHGVSVAAALLGVR